MTRLWANPRAVISLACFAGAVLLFATDGGWPAIALLVLGLGIAAVDAYLQLIE